MTSAVIVDAVRTPIAKGKPGGAYADIHPVDLHAHALRALIDRTGIDPALVDDVISTEAFAPVVLAWQKETGADLAKVNINGGAIAIGHPLGASGARLMTSLINVLDQVEGRYGLQARPAVTARVPWSLRRLAVLCCKRKLLSAYNSEVKPQCSM
jgi:acetyl-CoA acetyltransferase